MLLRQFELAAQDNYRRGKMPGFIHLYIGQEAVATGICNHLRPTDWITSTHRGHGHALAKGVPPAVVMAELFGKATGCNGGRGGSMHLYDATHGLFGTNGFVGGGIPAAVGTAIGARLRHTDGVSVAFFGDGAVNHGAFHEAVNFAAVQNAPIVFVCENNLYATATPLGDATRNTDIASRAAAYGIPGVAVDGNSVTAVWLAAATAVDRARRGEGPTLLEARTYRTVGHHEGDQLVGTYRTQQEMDAWKNLDPISRWREQLVSSGTLKLADLEIIDRRVRDVVDEAVQFALDSPFPESETVMSHAWSEPLNPAEALAPPSTPAITGEVSWLDAVRDAIAEEMRRDAHLVYFGEGTGERGGSFGHTKGLWAEFGAARMVDTPICELAFTGAAAGAAATGCRAVADLMFTDFMFEAASQIIQQAAKLRYMTNGRMGVPLIVRSGMGAIKNAGPHHSGCYYPLWGHCPGLIVVVPSNASDAKGLWKTALRAGDPVLMLEHKLLFATKCQVPEGEHFVPFGVAAVVREGADITLVSCGLLLHRCLDAAVLLAEAGIDCEVIDLRTIVPLDVDTVANSVLKTGRLLIVDEAFSQFGVGAELSAAMMELAFDALDAPIGRLHTLPVAHPFSPPLEDAVLVDTQKILTAAHSVMGGVAPLQWRVRSGVSRVAASTPAPPVSKNTPAPPASTLAEPLEEFCSGTPLVMPNVDLTITEATVTAWRKAVGEIVKEGETLVEMESSKAVYEVEAPLSGVLQKIVKSAGQTVSIGGLLGVIQPT